MQSAFLNTATIAAQATVSGEGGIAIIRMSGDQSLNILKRIFVPHGGQLNSRQLTYGHIKWDDEIVDEVMAVYLNGKRTYTREDMAEIHCHGSQYIAGEILSILIECGARLAAPGEFTYRAFINGRIDLSQAEAVMRLVKTNNEQARKSAVRQLDGANTTFIRNVQSEILDISAGISAYIDFPDEIDEVETKEMILGKCREIIQRIRENCNEKKGRMEDEGVFVALCGKPNAGKSSLLNQLIGEERAIVTDIPGTTRDLLRETIQIHGIRFTFIDTAGLRKSEDTIEQIGVKRAEKAIKEADIRLFLLDASEIPTEDTLATMGEIKPDLVLLSTRDIAADARIASIREYVRPYPVMEISSLTGEGIEGLKDYLCTSIEQDISSNAAFSQTRHLEAAKEAASALQEAVLGLESDIPLDFVQTDLMNALNALGSILGENASEAVIDRVFSSFCVGK